MADRKDHMAEQPAGWYPDPRGEAAQRYWDGSVWTDHVEGAAPTAFPPPPPLPPGSGPVPPAPAGYARPASTWSRSSTAGWALALSIVGILCCGPLAIAGLVMGRNEVQAIDRGEADPSQRGLANSAYIVGIVGIVFLVAQIGLIVVIFAAGDAST